MELSRIRLISLEALSEDFNRIFESGEDSDVVLSDGSKEILAHKFVLCVRSPVFAKMLKPLMKEKLVRIVIEDTSMEVLRELLHFMYNAKVNIQNSQMARELYVAADKFERHDLRRVCLFKLQSSMSVENVLETLILADLYNEKVLKVVALNFALINYSQLNVQGKWNIFMKEHQALANELSFIIDKK